MEKFAITKNTPENQSPLDQVEEFTESFFDRYEKKKFKLSIDKSLHIEDGDSLLLSNSTMCRYRDYIRDSRIHPDGVAAQQLCLRTPDLSRYDKEDYEFNFPSLFNMVGLMLPKESTNKLFRETYDWLVSVGIEPERIYIKTSEGDFLANLCIPDDFKDRILIDTERPSFYKWDYGMQDVFGEGLTFSILQNNGEILDIGNIIAFTDRDRALIGWETAFGVETLTARRDNVPLYKKYKIFELFGEITNEQQKPLLDSISSVIELIVQGFEPGPKKQSYILRKYLNIISKLSNRLEMDIDMIIIKYCNSKNYDAIKILSTVKNYLDVIKIQKEVNINNLRKYLKKNSEITRDKKTEIAKSTFALDEEDIVEFL